jgi:hypothetical protein
LVASSLVMSGLSYILFAEFPFVLGGLNAFVPAYMIANLTFYFAVSVRSSNAAGMLAIGCLLLVLMFGSNLTNQGYNPLINPFNIPNNVDLTIWEDTVLLNRVSVIGIGVLLLYLGLRKMERRERLLT